MHVWVDGETPTTVVKKGVCSGTKRKGRNALAFHQNSLAFFVV
jgi:hypothetical protein